jgi:hypothetical protein
MDPPPQVHLGNPADPVALEQGQEKTCLNAVTGIKRNLFQGGAPASIFAGCE